MNESSYAFPEYLQNIYTEVHHWLDAQSDTAGFRTRQVQLNDDSLISVATQFHQFFAAHYFKTFFALQEVVTASTFRSWIQDNDRICVVDVGCGGGSASVAFVEAVRLLMTSTLAHRTVHIHFVGVDPLKAALEINRAVMERLKGLSSMPRNLRISYEFVCASIPDCALDLHSHLDARRESWHQPSLPHVVLLQPNVVDYLAPQVAQVVEAYHQVFMATPIDRMHILSVTDKAAMRREQLARMHSAFVRRFTHHSPAATIDQELNCEFFNPADSFARTTYNRRLYPMRFRASFITVENVCWQQDIVWRRIVDADNLRLAWARTRTGLLRESLVDETDIRLFDRNVTALLNRLQNRLIVYAEDVAHPHDQVNYTIPKNATAARPKSLSRLEEEILSVAIVQAIVQVHPQPADVYAHRLNADQHSEFLYEFWGHAFNRFVQDVNDMARANPDWTTIRTDLSSYYTRISQTALIDRLHTTADPNGTRVRWLLEKVLKRQFHEVYHQPGQGVSQGGIGSGYYANIYLLDVDAHFLSQHPSVRYFRYVDDIVLFVQDSEDVPGILSQLDEQLQRLELVRSIEKTEIISAKGFSLEPGLNDELSDLSYDCNRHLKALWVAACHYAQQLELGRENFYPFVEGIQHRLRLIGIVTPLPMLRRKLLKYLNMPIDGRVLDTPIHLPEFGQSNQGGAERWAELFREMNPVWFAVLDQLHHRLALIVRSVLQTANGNYENISRSDNRRLRFAISRLCQLGMPLETLKLVIRILQDEPNQLREPAFVLECIALQGHGDTIRELYQYYIANKPTQTYIKSLLLRVMRHSDELPVSILMEVAISPKASLEERLMASEALLGGRVVALTDRHWAKIVSALNTPLAPRLKKNFILLMRQIRDRDPLTYRPLPGDDAMLFDAFDVEDGYKIFEEFEPHELQDYYEHDFPDDAYEYGEMLTTISY
jgi:hypothetical protein